MGSFLRRNGSTASSTRNPSPCKTGFPEPRPLRGCCVDALKDTSSARVHTERRAKGWACTPLPNESHPTRHGSEDRLNWAREPPQGRCEGPLAPRPQPDGVGSPKRWRATEPGMNRIRAKINTGFPVGVLPPKIPRGVNREKGALKANIRGTKSVPSRDSSRRTPTSRRSSHSSTVLGRTNSVVSVGHPSEAWPGMGHCLGCVTVYSRA